MHAHLSIFFKSNNYSIKIAGAGRLSFRKKKLKSQMKKREKEF
jgi:hypothetical protein